MRDTPIGTVAADSRFHADFLALAWAHQQISHIFSDKTGTLTQNKMIFRGCVVGTKRYGDRPSGMSTPASVSLPSASSGAPGTPGFRDPAVDFDATELLHDLRNPANLQQAELLREFLVNLAVCNSIIPEQRLDEHGEPTHHDGCLRNVPSVLTPAHFTESLTRTPRRQYIRQVPSVVARRVRAHHRCQSVRCGLQGALPVRTHRWRCSMGYKRLRRRGLRLVA